METKCQKIVTVPLRIAERPSSLLVNQSRLKLIE